MESKAHTEVAQWSEVNDQALPVGTDMLGGQFTISGHLGAGGFGITYRAHDNVLDREIVIKECFFDEYCIRQGKSVIPRRATFEASVNTIVKMFMREARALAKLRHPNIVGVHRVFEENGTAYMVLDLIEGRDLYAMSEASLPADQVKRILLQLLDAVEQVHKLGILHRDISPDNILVDRSGTPVLIDFGAAKGDASKHTRNATNVLVVKDGYSPYEFYGQNREQSEASDLYALGASFYHLLTGAAPANSQLRVLEIVGEQPDPVTPLAGRISGYDDAFLCAIDQAMEVHPKDRMQSAAEWRDLIAGDLVELQRPISAPAKPVVKSDLEIGRELSRLVEETNEEVRKTCKIQKKAPIKAPAPKAPAKPEWLDEFNQETLARQQADAIDAEAPVPPAVEPEEITTLATGPSTQEVNWIERAVEKQERQQIELERQQKLAAQAQEETPEPDMPIGAIEGRQPHRVYWPRVLASLSLSCSLFIFLDGF